MADKMIRMNTFENGETSRLAEYLNSMAEKGWRLEKINWARLRFIREKAEQGKYAVDTFFKSKSNKKKDYIDFCGETGWEYIDNNGSMYVFRAEAGNDPIPIQTDPEMEYRALQKSMLPIDILFLVFALWFFIFGLVFPAIIPRSAQLIPSDLMELPWWATSYYLPLGMLYLIYSICDIYWLRKQKKRLNQGKQLKPLSTPIVRTRRVVMVAAIAGVIALVVTAGIHHHFQQQQNETVTLDAAPILQLADFGIEDTPKEKWQGRSSEEIPVNLFYRETAVDNENVFIWMDYYQAKDEETAEWVFESLLDDENRFGRCVTIAEVSAEWQVDNGLFRLRPGDSEASPQRGNVLLRKGTKVWELRGSFDLNDAKMIALCRKALGI